MINISGGVKLSATRLDHVLLPDPLHGASAGGTGSQVGRRMGEMALSSTSTYGRRPFLSIEFSILGVYGDNQTETEISKS